jgi:hypothetical protein
VGELQDLEVDRVDGVDEPATGRRFILMKNAEGKVDTVIKAEEFEQLKSDAGKLITTAKSALAALAKGDGLALSDAQAGALNELAKLLEAGHEFKAATAKAADGTASAGAPAAGSPEAIAAAVGTAVADAIEKNLGSRLEKVEKALEARPPKPVAPASGQPAGEPITKGAPKKLGEGVFSNIVFGQ